jgi:hypothetical protein
MLYAQPYCGSKYPTDSGVETVAPPFNRPSQTRLSFSQVLIHDSAGHFDRSAPNRAATGTWWPGLLSDAHTVKHAFSASRRLRKVFRCRERNLLGGTPSVFLERVDSLASSNSRVTSAVRRRTSQIGSRGDCADVVWFKNGGSICARQVVAQAVGLNHDAVGGLRASVPGVQDRGGPWCQSGGGAGARGLAGGVAETVGMHGFSGY